MEAIAAIIPVAGLSSRMGSFKPLLELNGYPMITLTIQSALDGGARQACVVTGRNAEEVEAALPCLADEVSTVKGLKALDVSLLPKAFCTFNPDFAQSDMLHSIKLGLAALQGTPDTLASNATTREATQPYRAVFIVPGDMPGISPQTFAALIKGLEQSSASVLVPRYEGKRGHPLLVRHECFEAMLDYTGEGGLRQALASYCWEEIEVIDEGAVLDTDNPEDLAVTQEHVQKTRGVSTAVAKGLFKHYDTPSNVQAHTTAVSEVALRMARLLNAHGYGLDSELCRSGGLLHDLNRVEPCHSQVAASHLRERGYDALAEVVGAHDSELVLTPHMFTEATIVFVADKLVKETTLVSIKHRYQGAVKRFPPTTEIGRAIQKDSLSAMHLLTRYVEITGDEALLQGTSQFHRSHHHAKT